VNKIDGKNAFFIWVIFGIVGNARVNIFVDSDERKRNLILHGFLTDVEPPIHRENTLEGVFYGFDETSEFVRMALNPRKRGKLQNKADRYLASGLMNDLGVRDFYTEVKVRIGDEEITDLDLYLPKKKLWVEFTTMEEEVNRHFYEKAGRLATFGDRYELFYKSFDPESGNPIEKRLKGKEVDKMFYISLYPLRELDITSKLRLSTFYIIPPQHKDRLTHVVMDPGFQEKLGESYERLIEKLKEFGI